MERPAKKGGRSLVLAWEKAITIRLDSFIDPGLIRRVTGVVRELDAAEGDQLAEVNPGVTPVGGGPTSTASSSSATRRPATTLR